MTYSKEYTRPQIEKGIRQVDINTELTASLIDKKHKG